MYAMCKSALAAVMFELEAFRICFAFRTAFFKGLGICPFVLGEVVPFVEEFGENVLGEAFVELFEGQGLLVTC